MRRRSAILLLLVLTLAAAACGDDGGEASTLPGGSTPPTTSAAGQSAEVVWYTDWNTGAVARWNVATNSCDGVTPVGLSTDLIAVGLGWVWVTDCTGGQLVRLDIETGEVTGRVNLGSCPSALAIAFDLVWAALPSDGRIVAVDPESGAIVAEGTSDLDTPVMLAAGSLNVLGTTYYWRVDEVDVDTSGGNDVWAFKIEDAASTYTQLPGQALGLSVSVSGGSDTVGVLVGAPLGGQGSPEYDDPNYPTQLYDVGSSGATAHGAPLQGFYNYLTTVDGHYVATSKITQQVVVANGAVVPIPVGAPPGPPVGGPPPPGNGFDGSDGPGVWIGGRDPEQPSLWYFNVADPPTSLGAPQAALGCQVDGSLVGLAYYAILTGADISTQTGLAGQMDRSAFAMDPPPEVPVNPDEPAGTYFSSCSVGYESTGRILNGMEGTTDPGATVVLSIEYGTSLYTDVATVVTGDDGTWALPDLSVDDLGPPAPPADATITVIFTANGYDLGACRLDVET